VTRAARSRVPVCDRALRCRLTAVAAFDAAPDRQAGIAAARDVVARACAQCAHGVSINALAALPARRSAGRRMEALRPYLDGTQVLAGWPLLYGALNIRRDAQGAPVIEYWSTALSHDEPTNVAHRAMRLEMQREALPRRGCRQAKPSACRPSIRRSSSLIRALRAPKASPSASARRSTRLWRSRSCCGASCSRSPTCCSMASSRKNRTRSSTRC
jgi:hypothetical protein